MMEQNERPARKVAIADHIWNAFEDMARSMGSDRDGLINQAMFMFARLNGFLDAAPPSGARPSEVAAKAAAPKLQPVPSRPGPPVRDEALPAARPARDERVNRLDDDPERREVAERVLETAAELERLIKGKSSPAADDSGIDEASGSNVEQSEQHAEEPDAPEDAPMDHEGAAPDDDGAGSLYLMAENGDLDKISKERFVIGRGKHCDFVINSGKVSREHAVISRDDAGDYFIEDLGSSNGTWFNKQRIKKRKIEDGDEYYICSEKIKLVVR